ncbi:TonB-dependent siderophore receptor [Burkholderia pseudomultivorans]|uniref:TonB-dependent siderophore receptor n=1 Tax=Burkholderia pseudomultivorans TaxID=1207504 RepID=UPI001E5614B0|nr:TonB-dependent receptor [Burkholderia pseudomultivorans]
MGGFRVAAAASDLQPFHYKKNNKLIPYAGLVYDIDDTYSAYVSYTEIFKPQTDRDRNDNVLGPTKGKNTEIGIKGEYLDGRLNASIAMFEARLDGVPQIDSGHLLPDGSQAYYAANGTKSRGFDIDVQGEIMRDWNLYADISHFTASQGDGQRLSTQIPRTTARLLTTYRLPVALDRRLECPGLRGKSKEGFQALGVGRIANLVLLYAELDYEAAPQVEYADRGAKMDVSSMAAARSCRGFGEVILNFALCAGGDSFVAERHFHDNALLAIEAAPRYYRSYHPTVHRAVSNDNAWPQWSVYRAILYLCRMPAAVVAGATPFNACHLDIAPIFNALCPIDCRR